MKNLLRLFASLARFLDPRRVHSIKTGRASGKSCRKSLIINDQILHPPSKSSGNVRFCAFTLTPIPSLSEVIRSLRVETYASGLAGVENPNGDASLNTGPCNTPQSLHRVALCCSVLHRVSPKNLSDLRCNTSAFPTEPGRCMVVPPGCAVGGSGDVFRIASMRAGIRVEGKADGLNFIRKALA